MPTLVVEFSDDLFLVQVNRHRTSKGWLRWRAIVQSNDHNISVAEADDPQVALNKAYESRHTNRRFTRSTPVRGGTDPRFAKLTISPGLLAKLGVKHG